MFNPTIKGLLLSLSLLLFTACSGTNDEAPKVIPPLFTDETMPVISNESNISIKENQKDIMRIEATDNAKLRYSISGEDASALRVDSITGDVSFATVLPDFESSKTGYVFIVEASDGINTASMEITLTILNIKDESVPEFTSSSDFFIKENAEVILKLEAKDESNDILSYHFTGEDSMYFTLDSSNGEFSLNAPADFENDKTSYALIATVSDGENIASQEISITITDVIDETMPDFTNPNKISVDENQKSVMTLLATDNKESTLIYSISGLDMNAFNLEKDVLSFKVFPDFEGEQNIYSINIIVTDGTNIASEELTININDLDENIPIFISKNNISIAENHIEVLTLQATDDSVLSYSILGTDALVFDVNASTGVLTFKTAPNFEDNNNFYQITASVTDGLNSVEQDINITILNEAETQPVLASSLSITRPEGVLAGTYLDTFDITAQDDSLITSFVITGEGSEKFAIAIDGKVTLLEKLDYETKRSYLFDVYAENEAGKSAVKTLTINVQDEDDLYIKAIIYDDTDAGKVSDDKLYIYFSKEIDKSSIKLVNPSLNYTVNGIGVIGSEAKSFYTAKDREHSIGFAMPAGTVEELPTVALEHYRTTLSLVADGIHELNGNYPLDRTETKVLPFGALKRSEQKISYEANDDGDLRQGATPSYSRDDGNGTVLDHLTGLTWEDETTASTQTWAVAKTYCEDLVLGTSSEWRMPTRKELYALVNYGQAGVIDTTFTHTTITANAKYWTSTEDANDADNNVWVIDFSDGKAIYDAGKTDTGNVVRCVLDRQ